MHGLLYLINSIYLICFYINILKLIKENKIKKRRIKTKGKKVKKLIFKLGPKIKERELNKAYRNKKAKTSPINPETSTKLKPINAHLTK